MHDKQPYINYKMISNNNKIIMIYLNQYIFFINKNKFREDTKDIVDYLNNMDNHHQKKYLSEPDLHGHFETTSYADTKSSFNLNYYQDNK